MGLPILNFKFLPDRCHWGRNSSCVRGRRGAAGAATAPHCGQQQPGILSGVTAWCGARPLQFAKLTPHSSPGSRQGRTLPSHTGLVAQSGRGSHRPC